ncbi:hypothetical protein [Streptomyces sp. VRA16 Mangrove soil]|uniref:hypothetical protein n=1 Tax=Streptomyces sp. VRA16 Mangrove soil TaxID=2817434 RepID=UPI001A9E62D6|nr:hypothetical protein [Streptomyces sp. VRA16 Mangrove soil]MBO1332555.1 hypothetical protein [Streptomyces sp. VRA16 Mangrove soil]
MSDIQETVVRARADRLLQAAEPLYAMFTAHRHNQALSRDVVEVLAQTIDDDVAYPAVLAGFVERYRERLELAYADYGPTSTHFLKHGRCLLASQPESLIIFERLSGIGSRFRLRSAWEGRLPGTMLEDMGQIWGVAL